MGRWSRWMVRPDRRSKGPVAFVLSGGGPLGALQVGFLQGLLDGGVVPDLMIGASVGALNAVFTGENPTSEGARKLGEIWMRMRRDDLFPGGRIVSAWHAFRKGSHVFSNAGLRRIIETELGVRTFEELAVPVQLVAAELHTGEETWFDSGPIEDRLLASCAMPGVFPPVEIDGITYVDGGIANNVPVSRAVDLGAKKVYVLNVRSWSNDRPLNRPHDFMMHGMVLARAQRYRQDIERCRARAEVIEFPLTDVGYVGFTDLSHTSRLIDTGREVALSVLEQPNAEGKTLAPQEQTV